MRKHDEKNTSGWHVSFSCSSDWMRRKKPAVVNTYSSSSDASIVRTYYELDDNTWKCGEAVYTSRVELSGTYGTNGVPVTCVVLTNDEKITFDDVSDKLLSVSSTPTPETPVVVEIHS